MPNLLGSTPSFERYSQNIGTVAASGSPTIPVFVAPCRCQVLGVTLINGATVAAHTQNYTSVEIKNVGASGSGNVVLGSITTTQTGLTALVEREVPLTGEPTLSRGDVVAATVTKAGTGADLTNACIVIEWAPRVGR